jgi:hypothetical protein
MQLTEQQKPIAVALLKLRLEGRGGMQDDVQYLRENQPADWTMLDTIEIASWAFDVDQEDRASGMSIEQIAQKYELVL